MNVLWNYARKEVFKTTLVQVPDNSHAWYEIKGFFFSNSHLWSTFAWRCYTQNFVILNHVIMRIYCLITLHDDVIKWKHVLSYWPFVRGIRQSPLNSLHSGQWRGALMFSLICAWINGWVNTRAAGYLRRRRAHYDVTVMRSDIFLAMPCLI